MLSASQDQVTLPSTEIGRERVIPAGPWLSLSSMLLFLEFPHPSGPRWILSSLLLLSFLDLHPLRCASPSCSRIINRVLRFFTLPISSMSQAEQCSAYPCMMLSMAQEGQGHRGTVCLPTTEKNSQEETSEKGALRVCRELGQVAACAGMHKHACRLKPVPPLYWVYHGIFG